MNKWNNTDQQWSYRKINKKSFNRYSAGILPYSFDNQGKSVFLLGKDYDGDWSDFGGRCEFKDKDDPINTACREFYEETLGSVMNIQECVDKLSSCTKIESKTLNGSPYYMYLLYIEYRGYTEMFHKTSNFLKYNFHNEINTLNRIIEKNTIRWVTLDTLINCIENKHLHTPISLRGVFYKTLETCKEQLVFLSK